MLYNKARGFLFILIFVHQSLCFNVKFRRFDGAHFEPFNTQMQKREIAQFYDKAAYSFNGFAKLESVPVPFPVDICLMNLEGMKYAAVLHNQKDGTRHFAVYKQTSESYEKLYDTAMPKAIAMDCKELGAKGYIAIAYNLTHNVENARDGSPIFELTGGRLQAVQYFATPQLFEVYLRASGSDLFFLQTFTNTEAIPNLECPYYKWSGTTFIRLGHIPCSNARQLEPFSINYEIYVAIANYADQHGRTSTYSEIYKYVRDKKRFQLFQKIKTYGAVDVRYFSVPYDEVKRRRFLIFGNSFNRQGDKNTEVDSVIYVFEKGQFVPYQSISLYAVQQFLPVQNSDTEKFLLLVAAKGQDTQIYNLNDWKFELSDVQFTEGAMGKGVGKMRIYQENDQSYLVIANDQMTENETNIFQPIYKRDEHANSLRQEIIEWAKTQLQRLAPMKIDKLKEEAAQKLLKNQQNQQVNIDVQVQDIFNSNIQTAITNALVYPKMQFTSNYWQALSFAQQALEALDTEQQTTLLRAKRNVSPPNLLDDNASSQINDTIKVDTLIVRDHLQAENVNGLDTAKLEFEHINSKKVRVTDTFTNRTRAYGTSASSDNITELPSLSVEDLQISGKLNEHTWEHLLNDTFKRNGVQFFRQPTRLDNLTTETFMVTQNEISGHELQKLIPIDGGNYDINQNVHFEASISVKNLLVHQRLNNIRVQGERLDVLLKRTNETQVVKGPKRFENVRVLQPIAVAGQLLGPRLQLMAPHQVIHDDLVLHGDYIIHGDVIVSDRLQTYDIIAQHSNVSVKETLANALLLTQTLEDVNVIFEQPLAANNTQLSFVNTQDLQQLVKTQYSDLQVINGVKTFPNTLKIYKGFSEMKYLNSIDVEQLDQYLFLKSANQTIQVPMYFGKIIAPIVTSTNLTLNDKSLNAYLTKARNQHITATLHAERLTAKTAQFQNLQSNGRLFNQRVAKLQQQAKSRASNIGGADILQPNHKFQGTIYVENLQTNASINGHSLHDIEQQLRLLSKDIHFMGNYKFNHNMNINHLTFKGTLNGIEASEFGHSWLQKNGEQTFTAPQTFANVECIAGMHLKGTLNGHFVDDYLTNTYWIDRNEHISDVIFESQIEVQAPMHTGTINGVHVPLDMIYSNTTVPQSMYASAYVHEDLNVLGAGIFNVSTVNGLPLMALDEFLTNGYGYDTLHVEHGHFEQPPYYETLNGYNLQKLLESVWLTNENVNLNDHVELADATFEGLLDCEGFVNNVNLHYLKDNYLSLSRPQEVHTEMVFTSDVQFESDLTINNLKLLGSITETNSNTALNFDEFAANSLKISGTQEIRTVWSILSAQVQGNLHNVQINNLNLANDVVRLDMPNAEITAPKHIDGRAIIKKLYATPSSTVNNVPMATWLRDTVNVYDNATVRSITTLDRVDIHGDLYILGSVNNLTHFDEQTLLLKDVPQMLRGNVRILNLLPGSQRVLLNYVEHLRAESINGQNIEQFYANLAMMSSNIIIQGNLVFAQPLVVEEYHNDVYEVATKWRRHMTATKIENDVKIQTEEQTELVASTERLKNAERSSSYLLDHFELHQVLPSANATRLVPIKLNSTNVGHLQIFAVIRGNDESEANEYYQWSVKEQRFKPYANITRLLRRHPCSSVEADTYCLQSDRQIHKKFSFPRHGVKQLVALTDESVAVLLPNNVEIWSINANEFKVSQRIPVMQPVHIAVGKLNTKTYLAIITANDTNDSLQNTINIYSLQNGTQYRNIQNFVCIKPMQLTFGALPETGDLLLFVLSKSVQQPLQIYKYKGVMGFEKIVGLTTLHPAQHIQMLQLERAKHQDRHMLALFAPKNISFVEIVLKEF